MPPIPNLADWLKTANLVTSGTGQVFLTLMQDEEFRDAFTKIIEQPQARTFWTYQVSLLLAAWFFKAWKLQKSGTWGHRLFTQAWIGFTYWGCALLAVPMVVWGESYSTVLSHGLRAVFHVIFA